MMGLHPQGMHKALSMSSSSFPTQVVALRPSISTVAPPKVDTDTWNSSSMSWYQAVVALHSAWGGMAADLFDVQLCADRLIVENNRNDKL